MVKTLKNLMKNFKNTCFFQYFHRSVLLGKSSKIVKNVTTEKRLQKFDEKFQKHVIFGWFTIENRNLALKHYCKETSYGQTDTSFEKSNFDDFRVFTIENHIFQAFF